MPGPYFVAGDLFSPFCKQDLPCPLGFRFCLSCLSGCQPTCFLIVTPPASDSQALPYAFFPNKKMIRRPYGLGRGKPDDRIGPLRSLLCVWSDPKPNPPSYHVLRVSVALLRRLFRLGTNYRTRTATTLRALGRSTKPQEFPAHPKSFEAAACIPKASETSAPESETCIYFC